MVLLIGFGEPVSLVRSARARSGGACRSVVSGLRTRTAVTGHRGTQQGIAIRLDPLRAYRLFALPMDEVSDALVDAEELLGPSGRRLSEQLAESPSWPNRVQLLESALGTRLDRGPAPDPAIGWAWRRIRDDARATSVADIAEQSGWSRRQFERRFRRQIGLPPATVVRILRFQRALAALRDPGTTLAEVAARAGYSDQAHFARDVRFRTGSTPGELAGRRRDR